MAGIMIDRNLLKNKNHSTEFKVVSSIHQMVLDDFILIKSRVPF